MLVLVRPLVLALSLVFASAATAQTSAAKPIKVAALLHLTGEFAAQGAAFREGVELAAEEINGAGGVNGRPIEVTLDDSQYKPAVAHTIAKRVLGVDRVDAGIIGTFSELMASGPEFEKAKVPLVVLWDSAPEIEALGEYVFAIGPWTPSTGERGAEFLYNNLNARSVAVIDTSNEWSLAVTKTFSAHFAKLGGKIVAAHTLDPANPDFRTILSRVKQLHPDALYLPLPDNIVPFYKQLRQLGLKMPLVTADVLTEELIAQLGTAVEGVYQTQVADPDSAETRRMIALYQKRYGKPPPMTLFTAWGYDGLRLIAEGFKRDGASPESAAKALYTVKNYPGASAPVTINERGSSPTPISIFRVLGGKLVKQE